MDDKIKQSGADDSISDDDLTIVLDARNQYRGRERSRVEMQQITGTCYAFAVSKVIAKYFKICVPKEFIDGGTYEMQSVFYSESHMDKILATFIYNEPNNIIEARSALLFNLFYKLLEEHIGCDGGNVPRSIAYIFNVLTSCDDDFLEDIFSFRYVLELIETDPEFSEKKVQKEIVTQYMNWIKWFCTKIKRFEAPIFFTTKTDVSINSRMLRLTNIDHVLIRLKTRYVFDNVETEDNKLLLAMKYLLRIGFYVTYSKSYTTGDGHVVTVVDYVNVSDGDVYLITENSYGESGKTYPKMGIVQNRVSWLNYIMPNIEQIRFSFIFGGPSSIPGITYSFTTRQEHPISFNKVIEYEEDEASIIRSGSWKYSGSFGDDSASDTASTIIREISRSHDDGYMSSGGKKLKKLKKTKNLKKTKKTKNPLS